jgi:hypothetical protein
MSENTFSNASRSFSVVAMLIPYTQVILQLPFSSQQVVQTVIPCPVITVVVVQAAYTVTESNKNVNPRMYFI